MPRLCSTMERLTPTRSSADQAKTSLLRERQERIFFLVSRCQVFANYYCLLQCCWVEGYRLRLVVALELGLDFFVFDQAISFEAFTLCREAVYVSLPWNEVSFNVARCLLVIIDSDHALWPWDFHTEVEPMNGRLKFVDRASAHYGIVWVDHIDNVECDLLTPRAGCCTK
jgi:hypothetical protein